MKYLLFMMLFFFSLSCFAVVYKEENNQGNTVYSDTPEDNATPVALPKFNNSISLPQNNMAATSSTESTTGGTAPTGSSSEQTSAHKNYSAFTITDPTDQETFQNQRDIPVRFNIDPPLQEGDRIQLYVDGIPAGDPSADLQELAVHQVDRGQHQITATILDPANHVLMKTNNITVFIHYSAIPTGSNAIPAVSNPSGVTPSSPGSGVTPPASLGTGTVPPASSGSGTAPPPSSGSGMTPPASAGAGLVPPPPR